MTSTSRHSRISVLLLWVSMLGVVIAGSASVASLRQLRHERGWVDHTHDVIQRFTSMFGLVADNVMAMRGYLLVRDPDFAPSLRDGQERFRTNVEELERLVRDNPVQIAALADIRGEADGMFAVLIDEQTRFAPGAPLDGAQLKTLLGTTKRHIDRIRDLTGEAVERERTLLGIRDRVAKRQSLVTEAVLIVTCIVTAAGLLFAMWLDHRHRIAVRAAQAELVALNAGLDERIRLRTADLEAAQRILQTQAQTLTETNRNLESFSYSVSHDLKAPLRSIEGFSTILTRKLKGKIDPDAMRQLDIVRDSAKHMGRLITDVLAFSRLGREAMRTQPVSLREVATRVIDERKVETAGRQVRIEVAVDLPDCQGDPSFIYLVVSNLLGNAIKYSATKPDVLIRFGWQRGAQPAPETNEKPVDPGTVVYTIEDNGIGFDMKYYDKLFGVFQRIHTDPRFEGTGIGLATVRRIVERHRGRIWAEGRPDSGSTFYFTIGEHP